MMSPVRNGADGHEGGSEATAGHEGAAGAPDAGADADAPVTGADPAPGDRTSRAEAPAAATTESAPGGPAIDSSAAGEPDGGAPRAGLPQPDAAELARLVQELDAAASRAEAAERRASEASALLKRQTDLVEELHSENRALRIGEVREAMAPLIRGLARIADDLSRIDNEPKAEDFAHINGRVVELLDDCGVVQERPAVGAEFDPRRHQATGSAPTDAESSHMTIADLRRAGLRRDDGRILRAAEVVVFRYAPPVAPAPAIAAQGAGNAPEDANGESG
jgi:molecular chaperone GrpE (heat shock protein)